MGRPPIDVSEAGYTLAEVLAAMLIVGLALGMLFEGVQSISKLQVRATETVNDARTLGQAERALAALLAEQAETDARLVGDGTSFAFACPAGACSASLSVDPKAATLRIVRGKAVQFYALPIQGPVKLVYEGADGRYEVWPSSERQVALRGVSVVGAAGENNPLVVARPWIEQPRTCEFDMIARACRPSAGTPASPTP